MLDQLHTEYLERFRDEDPRAQEFLLSQSAQVMARFGKTHLDLYFSRKLLSVTLDMTE